MKRPLRRVLCATLFALLLAAGGGLLWKASLPLPIDEVLEWPTSPVLLDRRGEVFSVFLSPESEWSVPVSLEQMGRWLPFVAVEVEDRRFMEHGGIDYAALLRAIWQNVSAGKVISGASTITSQLVRLSFPRPRTLKTKLVEFTAAQKLEEILTKEEILELYLNRAPFGGNIRGVEAASRIYFSKGAGEVSLGEAALLVECSRGRASTVPTGTPEPRENGATPYSPRFSNGERSRKSNIAFHEPNGFPIRGGLSRRRRFISPSPRLENEKKEAYWRRRSTPRFRSFLRGRCPSPWSPCPRRSPPPES